MDIPVLIQPVPGKGFVASAPCFGWSAEGPTAEAAVALLQVEATQRETNGAQTAVITMNGKGPAKAAEHPLLKWAGTWDPNDPLIQEFEQAVADYRRQCDNDPNRY